MMRLILGATAALILTAGQAAADGLPKRGKTRADVERPCSVSAETGFSTEKVSRGFSESGGEDFSVQGGFELTCGRFYFGAEGTSVSVLGASALAELSVGVRPKTGPIEWDFGLSYHAYNSAQSTLNFYELKAAASTEIWKGGTLGASVAYSPEYGGRAALWMAAMGADANPATWTFEGTFTQELPKAGIFTPIFSSAIGQVSADGADYVYWNIGLGVDFLDKWNLSVVYSDTDIGIADGCTIPVGPGAGTSTCDQRVTVALKYSF